jgi:hypothetical protein
MDIQSTIATAKDVIVAISALTGAGVAFAGLSTWNRQIKGQASYELARRLLRNTYILRDTIADIHNDLVYALNSFDLKSLIDKNELTNAYSIFFRLNEGKKRIDDSEEILAELQTDFLEAEIIWKFKIKNDFNNLRALREVLRFQTPWIESLLKKIHKNETLEIAERDQLFELIAEYKESNEQGFTAGLNEYVEQAVSQVKKELKRF